VCLPPEEQPPILSEFCRPCSESTRFFYDWIENVQFIDEKYENYTKLNLVWH
jgi:hypothetical protein